VLVLCCITREVQFTDEHNTLKSVSNLASVLQDEGKYDEAERLNRRALEGRKKELGEQHPDTLTSVYCLAYLLQKQTRYEGASELHKRACYGYQQKLGSQHPTTIACVNHYASCNTSGTTETEYGVGWRRQIDAQRDTIL